MYKRFISIWFFLILGSILWSQDFQNLLEKADSLINFPHNDFSAEYSIVHNIPGEGINSTVSAVFRRDSKEKYVIIVLEPEINKGQGYLKLADTLWFYDPESRRFNFSSSKDRFQNSNARNSDFTQSTLAMDYDVKKEERVKLGPYDCWLLSLEANNDEVTYPIMKIWISDDNLVRKTEDYSLSNLLLRTVAIPSYQKIDNKFVPVNIFIIDNLSGAIVNNKFIHEKTQITISKVSFNSISDSVFSKTFLERVSR